MPSNILNIESSSFNESYHDTSAVSKMVRMAHDFLHSIYKYMESNIGEQFQFEHYQNSVKTYATLVRSFDRVLSMVEYCLIEKIHSQSNCVRFKTV